MVIANNFLFEWSAGCCLDSRWKLFVYLWFQGDDESLIDSQTIITGQILDNNTQRLTIENILAARAGQAAACWLSDLVARGRLGWAGHYEAKIVNQARGEGSLMWDINTATLRPENLAALDSERILREAVGAFGYEFQIWNFCRFFWQIL